LGRKPSWVNPFNLLVVTQEPSQLVEFLLFALSLVFATALEIFLVLGVIAQEQAWSREGVGARKKKNKRMSKGDQPPQALSPRLFIAGTKPKRPECVAAG
jgi:hypothetical protein